VVAACGTGTPPDDDGSGGTASGATGGVAATGGSAASGGRSTGGSGAGGSKATGGSGTGGASSGGSNSGASSTGGFATGGTGGSSGTGNAPCTNVRPTGTDWDDATCAQWASESAECDQPWMVDNDYCNESCGRCSSGSGGSTGGTAGRGGSGSGGTGPTVTIPPSGCTEGERMVCNNQTQMHCGYTSEYWKDQGTGCMINKADGFSIDWTDVNNLLARKGIRPGSADLAVTFDADYQPDGNSYLNVYGWVQNPLAEYYIVDSWGSWRPPGATAITTIESDGGTYDIYRTERTNAPSIEGNKDFPQYWSVRTEKRDSGTITVGNHFSAWQSNGMPIGRLYEVSLNVEGYQSSGVADVRMLIQ
jgi:endo-1,4-beta-xylanase